MVMSYDHQHHVTCSLSPTLVRQSVESLSSHQGLGQYRWYGEGTTSTTQCQHGQVGLRNEKMFLRKLSSPL